MAMGVVSMGLIALNMASKSFNSRFADADLLDMSGSECVGSMMSVMERWREGTGRLGHGGRIRGGGEGPNVAIGWRASQGKHG